MGRSRACGLRRAIKAGLPDPSAVVHVPQILRAFTRLLRWRAYRTTSPWRRLWGEMARSGERTLCYPQFAMRLPGPRRRHQLLDVARELFAAGGFHATSMDDVAEAAGVTKPVLYQHFPSKRALYRELLEDVGSRLMADITAAMIPADTGRERVEKG